MTFDLNDDQRLLGSPLDEAHGGFAGGPVATAVAVATASGCCWSACGPQADVANCPSARRRRSSSARIVCTGRSMAHSRSSSPLSMVPLQALTVEYLETRGPFGATGDHPALPDLAGGQIKAA